MYLTINACCQQSATSNRQERVFRFINAIENWSPLWDSRCADYAKRLKKQECWNEVCKEQIEDFDPLSKDKQNEVRM
jgi:hypothetical protein